MRRSWCWSGGHRGLRDWPAGGAAAARRGLREARRVWHDLRFKDLYQNGKQFELMQRALGFAALAILTVFPLLIVVAAASSAPHRGLAGWVVYGMGLTGSSADAVTVLFSAPAGCWARRASSVPCC